MSKRHQGNSARAARETVPGKTAAETGIAAEMPGSFPNQKSPSRKISDSISYIRISDKRIVRKQSSRSLTRRNFLTRVSKHIRSSTPGVRRENGDRTQIAGFVDV